MKKIILILFSMMFLAQTRSQQIEPKKTEAEKNMFLNNGSRDTEQKNKNQSPDDLKSNKSIAAINYKIAGNNLDDACEKTNENYGGWHRLVGTNSSGAGHAFPIGSHLSGFSSTFTIGTGHQEPYFGIFNSGDDDFLKNNCYPSVLLPVVPNGSTSSSIRMGWHAGSEGKVAERIFKRFQVTSSNQIYYYKYAYVMQGDFAAFFMSRVYDATTGAVLMQRQTPYKVQYATGNPGPIVPSIPFYWESDPALHPTFTDQIPGDYADSKIFYKEWTCDSFDLRNYIGQELVIEFTNADCQWGGHFAYTYINDFCEECTPTPPPTCNCDKFKLLDVYCKTYNNQVYGNLVNIQRDKTIDINCKDTLRFFSNFVCPSIVCRNFSLDVTDPDGVNVSQLRSFNEFVFSKAGIYNITLHLKCDDNECENFTFKVSVTCPCNCPPKPTITLTQIGRPGIIKQLNCGANEEIECNKLYSLSVDPACQPVSCSDKNFEISVRANGGLTQTFINQAVNIQPLVTDRDFTITIKTYCGGKLCTTCTITLTVKCKCPPPPCCKNPVGTEFNAATSTIRELSGTSLANLSFNLNGNGKQYTQVRASVISFGISADDKKCLDCYNNSRQWASISGGNLTGVQGFIRVISGDNNGVNTNTREVTYTSSTPQIINTAQLTLNLMLPPMQTLSCCNVNATVYIKLIFRDNDCNECEKIIGIKIPLSGHQGDRPELINTPANIRAANPAK